MFKQHPGEYLQRGKHLFMSAQQSQPKRLLVHEQCFPWALRYGPPGPQESTSVGQDSSSMERSLGAQGDWWTPRGQLGGINLLLCLNPNSHSSVEQDKKMLLSSTLYLSCLLSSCLRAVEWSCPLSAWITCSSLTKGRNVQGESHRGAG